MKILILGVSGFIGGNLYKKLSEKATVYGLSRSKVALERCKTADFSKEFNIDKLFPNIKFDVVINLASVMANSKNLQDLEDLLIGNIKMTGNIIEALRSQPNSYLINFSSTAVYPNITGIFTEASIVDPSKNTDALYGLSKFNSEVLFNYLLSEGQKVIHLRTSYVYGEGMDETRIHKMFEKELKAKNTITIFGNGERMIPQVSISYLVEKVSFIIQNKPVGIKNLVEENILLQDYAKRLVDKFGNEKSTLIFVEKGNRQKFQVESINHEK
ncbi:NAD-dependent epimerase/dehydratase family protein [Christiangramia portivictoriae]|uniref:NAD-dependent epimerase/dehydratase family protein n=1 Tax=Christiangramia portivictoriae TaxID=326069 RepID=UPI0004226DFE|nr:NAD(P)-dependent oxidoreductase [Christiangramia portivictoriae]